MNDKRFCKPHFGPEETDEQLIIKLQAKLNKKRVLCSELNNQMQQKENLNQMRFNQERQADLDNLDLCQNTFVAEERAIAAKNILEK